MPATMSPWTLVAAILVLSFVLVVVRAKARRQRDRVEPDRERDEVAAPTQTAEGEIVKPPAPQWRARPCSGGGSSSGGLPVPD